MAVLPPLQAPRHPDEAVVRIPPVAATPALARFNVADVAIGAV